MDYCPKCCLVVAPFDPMKVKVGDKVYHGKCHTEQVQAKTRFSPSNVKRMKQMYFRFVPSTMIH